MLRKNFFFLTRCRLTLPPIQCVVLVLFVCDSYLLALGAPKPCVTNESYLCLHHQKVINHMDKSDFYPKSSNKPCTFFFFCTFNYLADFMHEPGHTKTLFVHHYSKTLV